MERADPRIERRVVPHRVPWALVWLVAAFALTACPGAETTPAPSPPDAAAPASPDLSTPEAAAETFLRGLQERDAALAGAAWHDLLGTRNPLVLAHHPTPSAYEVLSSHTITPADVPEDVDPNAQGLGYWQPGTVQIAARLRDTPVEGREAEHRLWVQQLEGRWKVVEWTYLPSADVPAID